MRTATSATREWNEPASASEYTAIVRRPKRCAVRAILAAISPRLAMRSDLNTVGRGLTGVEQLATNQHAPHFAGAGADLVQLGIAQQAPGRVLVHVPVAAQCLHRLQSTLRGVLARE